MDGVRENILEKLRSVRSGLEEEFPIHRLAIFGSVARGEATPESDIDVLVEIEPSVGLGFVVLADRLEALLGRQVDLVSRRGIKPSLWRIIEPDLIDV